MSDERENLTDHAKTALGRLRSAFPAHRWADVWPEWARALNPLEPPHLDAAVTQAITETDDRYPPPIARIVATTRGLTERRRRETERRPELRLTDDEAALRDAIAALDSPYFADHQREVLEQIDRIRLRLPDHGARIDGDLRTGLRHVVAAPHPRDQDHTIRYVAIQPSGAKVPPYARTVEDQDMAA